MKFRVRVFDSAAGDTRSTEVEAMEESAAIALVEGRGLVVLDIQRRAAFVGTLFGAPLDVRLFCQELRTLLGAGMTVVEAIETLVARAANSAEGATYRALLRQMQEGKALSTAMQAADIGLPKILIASVRASERTGRMVDALSDYLRYDEMIRNLRKRVINAAIYPGLVLGFGFSVVLFLLGYVVPRFTRIYADMTSSLSTPTYVLITIGSALNNHGWLVAALVVICVSLLVMSIRSGMLARASMWLMLNIAVFRRNLRYFQLARIYHTLALLIRGGFTVVESISFARDLAFEGELRVCIDRARDQVNEGVALGQAFSSAGLTDVVSERLLRVGERSGNVDRVLAAIAEDYAQKLEVFVERITRLVEPLLLMVVGLVIGAIVVLMYMPIFDLANGLR